MRPSGNYASRALLLSFVTFISSHGFITNSYTNEVWSDQEDKIHEVRSQMSVTDPGCPTGFWYTDVMRNECTGEATISKECPKDFNLVQGVCSGPAQECSSRGPGYNIQHPPIAGFQIYCAGPPTDKPICPTGYHLMEDKKFCIGPRQA